MSFEDWQPEPARVCPGCRAPLLMLRSPLGPPMEVCFVCWAEGKTEMPQPVTGR